MHHLAHARGVRLLLRLGGNTGFGGEMSGIGGLD